MPEFLYLYKFTLSLFSRISFLASLNAANKTYIDKFVHSSEDILKISDTFFFFSTFQVSTDKYNKLL
jgi:hypothetical protein